MQTRLFLTKRNAVVVLVEHCLGLRCVSQAYDRLYPLPLYYLRLPLDVGQPLLPLRRLSSVKGEEVRTTSSVLAGVGRVPADAVAT